MKKKIIATIVGVTLVCGMFTGCGSKTNKPKEKVTKSTVITPLDSNVTIEDLQKATKDYYTNKNFKMTINGDGKLKINTEEDNQETNIKLSAEAEKDKNIIHTNINAEANEEKTKTEVYFDISDLENIIAYSSNDDGKTWYKGINNVNDILGDIPVSLEDLDEDNADFKEISDEILKDTKIQTKDGSYVLEVNVPADKIIDKIKDSMKNVDNEAKDSEDTSNSDFTEQNVINTIFDQMKSAITIKETFTFNENKILTGINIKVNAKDLNLIMATCNGEITINVNITPNKKIKVEIPKNVIANAVEETEETEETKNN